MKITDERKSRIGDKICVFCGSRDLLDTARSFYVSEDTFRKFKSYEGVKAKVVVPLGDERDIVTGKLLWVDFMTKRKLAFYIIEAPVCLKCMWHILGRQRKPMKADDSVIFY